LLAVRGFQALNERSTSHLSTNEKGQQEIGHGFSIDRRAVSAR
jgi:hypothetical protein